MTRIINVYDNYLWADQSWNGIGRNTRRRVLTNVNWDSIIESRLVLLRDFNDNSPD